jgi:cholesterol 24(S)-hydroxylase
MVLVTIAYIVFGVPLFCLALYALYLKHLHAKYEHLPGPQREGFFSGNMPMVKRRRNREKIIIHQIWADLAAQHDPLYVFWFFHRPVVMISDAALVKEVLIKLDLPKDPFGYSHFAYLFGQRLLGGSLLSEVDHKSWKKKRALLNPAFNHKYLANLMSQFNQSCGLFLNKLLTLADGETEVSMAEELVRLALDVVGKVQRYHTFYSMFISLLEAQNHTVSYQTTSSPTCLQSDLCLAYFI